MTRPENRRVEAVLFDFDHTLGVDHRLEESVLRDLTERFCRARLSDAGIADALASFRSGEVTLADMLARAFAGCDCGEGILSTYRAAALERLPERLEPMPGASETLSALRSRGYVVAILSNGWRELQMCKAAAIGFDGPVIVSETIGAWKPDARAFEIAGRQLGVKLPRSVYVGDSPVTDVEGSKAAGMISIWADLEAREYPPDAAAPDYSIRSLVELPAMVEAIGSFVF